MTTTPAYSNSAITLALVESGTIPQVTIDMDKVLAEQTGSADV